MQRNNASRERIEKIIAVQMDDAEKMSRCQYVIINDNTQPLLPQVLSVHKQLILL
jgi:dephospho-CoA kinase